MEPEVFCAISDGPGSNRAVRMPTVEIFARTTSLPLFAAEFIAAHNDWKPFSMRLKESDVAAPSIAAPISASSFGSGTGTWECAPLRACRERTTNRDGAIVGGYYSPYIWPTTIYGYAGPAYDPYPASVYSEPAYASPAASPAVSQGEVDLAYQVGRLSQEIEQLRQQQAITSYTQPPATSQVAPQQRTPTVLVFRDGHRMEMQNYAIVGQTLWVFDERAATKIPLSDLDLDATQKENRGSGFRFPLQEK